MSPHISEFADTLGNAHGMATLQQAGIDRPHQGPGIEANASVGGDRVEHIGNATDPMTGNRLPSAGEQLPVSTDMAEQHGVATADQAPTTSPFAQWSVSSSSPLTLLSVTNTAGERGPEARAPAPELPTATSTISVAGHTGHSAARTEPVAGVAVSHDPQIQPGIGSSKISEVAPVKPAAIVAVRAHAGLDQINHSLQSSGVDALAQQGLSEKLRGSTDNRLQNQALRTGDAMERSAMAVTDVKLPSQKPPTPTAPIPTPGQSSIPSTAPGSSSAPSPNLSWQQSQVAGYLSTATDTRLSGAAAGPQPVVAEPQSAAVKEVPPAPVPPAPVPPAPVPPAPVPESSGLVKQDTTRRHTPFASAGDGRRGDEISPADNSGAKHATSVARAIQSLDTGMQQAIAPGPAVLPVSLRSMSDRMADGKAAASIRQLTGLEASVSELPKGYAAPAEVNETGRVASSGNRFADHAVAIPEVGVLRDARGSDALSRADASARGVTLESLPQQFVQSMGRLAMSRGQFTIALSPQALGSIDVEFKEHRGEVSIAIYARDATTRDLLEQMLSRLRETLTESGVSLADLDIRREHPDKHHKPLYDQQAMQAAAEDPQVEEARLQELASSQLAAERSGIHILV